MPDVPELEALLHHLHATASAAWPEVPLPAPRFIEHLLGHLPAEEEPVSFLKSLHIEDLYLACACAEQIAPALAAFDRKYLSQVGALLPEWARSVDMEDEVRQVLRVRLLVAQDGARPKIASYAGAASLFNWLRTSVVREAISLRRRRNGPGGAVEEEAAMDDLPLAQDTELYYIKEQHREAFAQALRDALRSLSEEQRLLLKLHHLDGLSYEALGTAFAVSRATAARRHKEACEAVREAALEFLRQRLHLTPAEFDSLVKVLASKLDVSIASLLARRQG